MMAKCRSFRYVGLTAAVIVAAVLGYGAWRHWSQGGHAEHMLRLVGVAAQGNAAVYSPDGKKIGTTFGEAHSGGGADYDGMFIFDASMLGDDVTLDNSSSVAPRGASEKSSCRMSREGLFSHDGKKLLYADFNLEKSYRYSLLPGFAPLKIIGWQRQLTSVDVTVRYWRASRGEAQYTFEGPFAYGKTIRAKSGKKECSITPWFRVDGNWLWGTEVVVESTGTGDECPRVLAYDRSGRRFTAGTVMPQSTNGHMFADIIVSGVRLEDIAFITINEKAAEETFRDVMIAYPGGPFDKNTAPTPIPASPQARLAADDPLIRCYAVRDGLEAKDAAFVKPAFELLSDDNKEARRGAAEALVSYAKDLSAEDIKRIAGILSSKGDPAVEGLLVKCLAASERDEVAEAWGKLAGDDRTWLWWNAMRAPQAKTLEGERGALPRAIQVREVIAGEFLGGESDAQVIGDARALLPTLLTMDLAVADPECFDKLLAMTAQQGDRKAATAAIVTFLKETDGQDFPGPELSADCAVGYLNSWYGLGLPRLKDKWGAYLWMPGGQWRRQVAHDAVQWYETGSLPAEIVAGYRAGDDDLRLVIVDSTGSGEPLVRLLPARADAIGTHRPVQVHFDSALGGKGGRVDCHLMPLDSQAGRWTASVMTQWDDGNGGGGLFEVRLPTAGSSKRIYGRGAGSASIYAEKATDPISVAAGTKAFKEYWEKYVGTPLPAEVESTSTK